MKKIVSLSLAFWIVLLINLVFIGCMGSNKETSQVNVQPGQVIIAGSGSNLAVTGVLIEVALTKSFNMEIIAEGVETKKQREQLLSLSCPLMQGYLFARPLPADKFAEMLSHWQKKVV